MNCPASLEEALQCSCSRDGVRSPPSSVLSAPGRFRGTHGSWAAPNPDYQLPGRGALREKCAQPPRGGKTGVLFEIEDGGGVPSSIS